MNAQVHCRRVVLTSLVVAGLLGLAACLPVPLGDPEKSKVDSSYVGAWEWADGDSTNIVTLRPYDERTYLVDAYTITGTIDEPRPKWHGAYKAWLTKVKGETFITMQPAETLAALPGEKLEKHYLIAKLKLEEGKLKATGIDGGYKAAKEAGTPTALEQVIRENMDDVSMWTKPIVASPIGADRMSALAKVMKAFSDPK